MPAFILACYGMTIILCYGTIFDKIRPNHKFFKCPLCIGFWVGIFNWFFMNVDFNVLSAGFISAGASYFISRLVDDDGILFKVKKE